MAMVKKDKGKTMVQALYVYQYTKGFFLSKLETFLQRIRAVAVASFPLRLTEAVRQAGRQVGRQ